MSTLKSFNHLILLALFVGSLPFTQANEKPSDEISNPLIVQPFIATYSILHKSDPVGTSTRTLKKLVDGNFEYSYHSKIKWLIFSDKRRETSILKVDDNKVIPISYLYKRKGTGRDKSYHWSFDHNESTATNIKDNRTIKLDITNGLQDKLSYHLQHRINLIKAYETPDTEDIAKKNSFSYSVVSTSGSIKDYVYQNDGEEELVLPYGLIKTVRFKREVLEKKRVTYAWFAPELDFLLVKLYQVKAGVEQFEAQLTTLTVNDVITNDSSLKKSTTAND